jgi:hypothetical protein
MEATTAAKPLISKHPQSSRQDLNSKIRIIKQQMQKLMKSGTLAEVQRSGRSPKVAPAAVAAAAAALKAGCTDEEGKQHQFIDMAHALTVPTELAKVLHDAQCSAATLPSCKQDTATILGQQGQEDKFVLTGLNKELRLKVVNKPMSSLKLSVSAERSRSMRRPAAMYWPSFLLCLPICVSTLALLQLQANVLAVALQAPCRPATAPK